MIYEQIVQEGEIVKKRTKGKTFFIGGSSVCLLKCRKKGCGVGVGVVSGGAIKEISKGK